MKSSVVESFLLIINNQSVQVNGYKMVLSHHKLPSDTKNISQAYELIHHDKVLFLKRYLLIILMAHSRQFVSTIYTSQNYSTRQIESHTIRQRY